MQYNRSIGADYSITDKDVDEIIKALEQQSTLNKIRDEIKALSPEPFPYDVVEGDAIKDAVWEILTDVLEIIDKYRESEE